MAVNGPTNVTVDNQVVSATVNPEGVYEVVTLLVQGPMGPPGSNVGGRYEHDQVSASTTWTISHNLGFKPGGILVLDSLGRTLHGQVTYVDDNVLTITFSAAVSGTAYLS